MFATIVGLLMMLVKSAVNDADDDGDYDDFAGDDDDGDHDDGVRNV